VKLVGGVGRANRTIPWVGEQISDAGNGEGKDFKRKKRQLKKHLGGERENGARGQRKNKLKCQLPVESLASHKRKLKPRKKKNSKWGVVNLLTQQSLEVEFEREKRGRGGGMWKIRKKTRVENASIQILKIKLGCETSRVWVSTGGFNERHEPQGGFKKARMKKNKKKKNGKEGLEQKTRVFPPPRGEW